MAGRLYVGTAGWAIPRSAAHRCPPEGSHLERYARLFTAAEINSSFYRTHASATYARWAATASGAFRFAVKLPRVITHEQLLRHARRPFEQFLADTQGLGVRRGPLLCQLPPSFAFDARVAARFFAMVRERHADAVVCEPRHPSWFGTSADALLRHYRIARAAADPAITETAGRPGGWPGVAYFRLHGTPRMYWSPYGPDQLAAVARQMLPLAAASDVWCIFDNTASGAAFENAWDLQRLILAAGRSAG